MIDKEVNREETKKRDRDFIIFLLTGCPLLLDTCVIHRQPKEI